MKRALQVLLALALLPLLVSTEAFERKEQSVELVLRSTLQRSVLQCHYEAEISGRYTRRDGSTFEAPIGRIVVTTCSSPEDLARRVEELTNNVRRQATAQALSAKPITR